MVGNQQKTNNEKPSLISGAARIAGYRYGKKIGAKTDAKAAIAYRRSQRKEDSEQERSEGKARAIGNRLQYRKMLQTAGKGASKSKIQKVKTLNKRMMVLGSSMYPMFIQTIFAAITIVSLSVKEEWWGFIVPGITMATIAYAVTVLLGTYTMIIATFALAKELADIKVVLIFIFCFSANWVPGLQIVPWAGVWIGYIIFRKK